MVSMLDAVSPLTRADVHRGQIQYRDRSCIRFGHEQPSGFTKIKIGFVRSMVREVTSPPSSFKIIHRPTSSHEFNLTSVYCCMEAMPLQLSRCGDCEHFVASASNSGSEFLSMYNISIRSHSFLNESHSVSKVLVNTDRYVVFPSNMVTHLESVSDYIGNPFIGPRNVFD